MQVKFTSGDFRRKLAETRKPDGRAKTDIERYGEHVAALETVQSGSEAHAKLLADTSDLREKLYTAKQLGSSPIVNGDGAVLEWPGEAPAVGDSAMLVSPDGSSGPAPDGQHTVESGYVITVEAGIITAVTGGEVDAKTEEPAKEATETVGLSAADVKSIVDAEVKKVLTTKLSGKGFGAVGQRVGFNILQSLDNSGKVMDGLKLLQASRHPSREIREKYQRTVSNKSYAIGSDVTALLVRSLNSYGEALSQATQSTGLMQFVRQINTGAYEQIAVVDRPIDIDLPRIAVSGVSYRKRVDACSFDPQGVIVASRRLLRANPGTFDMEVCPEAFEGLFNGVIFIDEQTIPAESIVLDIVMRELAFTEGRQIFNGNRATTATDVIDGLETLLAADVIERPNTAPFDIALTAPTDLIAVEQIDLLLDALENAAHNPHVLKKHYLFVSPLLASQYRRDYMNTFSAAAGSNVYDSFLTPLLRTGRDVTMVAVEELTGINRAYLVPEDALFFARLKEDTSAREDPRTRSVLLSYNAHLGLQYGFPREIIRGTW
jgi:hypothetical protein